jgi:hypothetical protein
MMTARVFLSILGLAALSAAPGAATGDPARAFLMSAFKLSAAEIGRIDGGQVVTRTLDVTNHREIATLGIVRIRTTPQTYVDRLTDIATFKRTPDIVQIGTFSNPSQHRDVAALTIDDADLKGLRECRVEDCEVRLSAEAIDRFRRDIDWRMADAPGKATREVQRFLVDYVARYRQGGAAAAMEYADRPRRLNVGREFASMIEGDTVVGPYASPLYQHLLDYPAASAARTTDFVYWSKERVRGRLVVSVTHVAIAPDAGDSPVAYAIGSKQIYAMHYYDASLGLTLLVPDRIAPGAPPAATYVVYLNRSRIDLFDGLFGGVARRIVAGKAKTLVAEQLQRLQGSLAAAAPQGASPTAR